MLDEFSRLNRRSLLSVGWTASAWLCLERGLPGASLAAEEMPPLNRFPRMMQEFMVSQVRAAHLRSVRDKAVLKTRQEAELYVTQVQQKIAACFGPKPPRTPLNARITGVIERDIYRIEKVIFDSRPNFPVTANLYLPKRPNKSPAVVGSCGHSANGKAAEAYQSFAQGLARLGYVCLIYDPIGQGERLQYGGNERGIAVGVEEHLHAGNQQFLVGENLSMWRAWDGIRALDYLLTRPEVDSAHVGITGNSGGGTMTTWLCGLEPRWTMAAPACFVTTFLNNMENELPADTEQCPPHVLAMGLEHEDFLAAMAPRPIIILAKERDYFDVRGSEAAYQRLKHLYELLGQPENIALHTGPTEHGYSIENREAMYGWFNRATGASAASAEPEIVIEKDETLWCTKSGQVQELNPRTVFAFTRDKALALKGSRGQVGGSELVRRIGQVLSVPTQPAESPPPFRILRDFGVRGFPRKFATTYAVETEPGVFAICYLLGDKRHLSRPFRSGTRAMLYVSHRSSDAELRQESWLRDMVNSQPDRAVFSCDVRGIGESLPNTCGTQTFDSSYGCDYFYAAHGIMLDRPYLGQKVLDILRVLQWMRSYGYENVDLVAQGWGAIAATCAAVVDERVASVYLKNALPSFEQLATDEYYQMPLAYLPFGVLEHFDLPDCYSALQDKLQMA